RPRQLNLMMERMLDDALDRREAGAAGRGYDRLVGLFAQIEKTQRTFEAQNLAPFVLRKQRIGKKSAGHMANVQLEQFVGVRRRREREAAALTLLQQKVDVLAGQKLQTLVRRQLQLDDCDVGRRLVDRLDAARQAPDLNVAGTPHFAHFD